MKIVVLDGATLNPGDNPWDEIERLGQLTVFANTACHQVVERAAEADVLIVNKVVIDEPLIAQLPNLKFIAVTATGYNVVDVAAAAARKILVSNVPIYGTESVAQFVFAGLLSFIHRPELHHGAILAGEWARNGNFSFWKSPLTELAGKTMGIVGFGRIGRAAGKLANAFGMKVLASSRTHKNDPPYEPFEWREIEALFAESDFVSLHCPLTPTNVQFVNRSLIEKMKPSAVLINTARGGLINEFDLAAALNADRIGGAVLDVVSEEPIGDNNPLLGAKNCLLTPHLAWATIEARKRLLTLTAENITAFQKGSPINTVA